MLSMNIHPIHDKWEKVDVRSNGAEEGSCVAIWLDGLAVTLSLHYGGEENKAEFVRKFKEAVARIPEECPTCKRTL